MSAEGIQVDMLVALAVLWLLVAGVAVWMEWRARRRWNKDLRELEREAEAARMTQESGRPGAIGDAD